MRKKVIAFYDFLLYAIICGPLFIIAMSLLLLLITKGTNEWIYKNWYLVPIFAITCMITISGPLLFRYCVINDDFVHFYYFTSSKSWKKAGNNIDIRWNQNIIISEIKNVEIVKLTEEEKHSKVYYNHWFNKYLKISLKYGKYKYVYVGNYSNNQIESIIKFMKNNRSNV